MIGYFVPHRVFPAGYHCDPKQPLMSVGLASQKNHMALYLMCIYGHEETKKWFKEAWAKSGKKLDIGKSCVRFKKLEDVSLETIGKAIRRMPTKKYVQIYLARLAERAKAKAKGAKKNK